MWVPPFTTSAGSEVVDLAAAHGLVLDPWQRFCLTQALALDPARAWLCFEVAIVVSRQNGKGSILEAVELAWLFLFGEKLVIHSAHLFETSREHFLRIQALVNNYDYLRKRVRRIREGRGSEEVELLSGARLKFMTRKGGAGRGFTASKVVMDEAMYLDAAMIAAGLPTMATIKNAQIWYTGSAGNRTSTQLGAVRARAYDRDDPSLCYLEWSIDERLVEEGGDDRSLPATWAKANPGFPRRITADYIAKEARAMGGYDSITFGTERLGVGDWPAGEEIWDIVDEQEWLDVTQPDLEVPARATLALMVDTDPARHMTTIAAATRARGAIRVEVVERLRGTAGVVDWLKDFRARTAGKVCAVVILKAGAAGAVIEDARKAKLPVQSPLEIEYAQACGKFQQGIKGGAIVHIGQPPLNRAIAVVRKASNREGGWRYSRAAPVDVTPIIAVTGAVWGLERFENAARDPWAVMWSDVQRPLPLSEPGRPDAARVGAAGYAAAKRGPR
jgi:phage terminase large subunit-like protein